jgi:predicted DsbA family dithiol-disulfide isomerase
MTQSVTIDFVSDVVCPWCALDVTALEQAIENLASVEYYEQMLRQMAQSPTAA